MRISLSEGRLAGGSPKGTSPSRAEDGTILTSLSLGLSRGTMRTPLSSLVGGALRDLLEPTLGAGETGALEPCALLPSASMEKSRSLPSMTRRTSLSLDALGGGDLVEREPLPEGEGVLPLAGCLPRATSSPSSTSRLKLNTS